VDTNLGNGTCNANLNCSTFNYDNGDCTPGASCGVDQVYDCTNSCVTQVSVDTNLGNGTCNANLNCSAFNYDNGDCTPVAEQPCVGNDCSTLGGIDTCSYDFSPWWVEVTWANAPHGGDSKRDWPGYSGAPTVPEMDCVVCHDPHGSYDAVNNSAGNPYMIRDFVEGSQFLDDSARPLGNPILVPGTDKEVFITNPDDGMMLGNQLCIRCHIDWEAAYSWHSYGCTGCLTCHSHGAAWDSNDWGDPPVDTQWCP
jgi:hypothetical protein